MNSKIFVAGLVEEMDRLFARLGDTETLEAESEGQVDVITLFSTTLLHPDRSRIVVPNRKVVGEILQNFGRIRQAEILVGIGYDSDVSAALQIIRDLVQANPAVLKDPEPVIVLLFDPRPDQHDSRPANRLWRTMEWRPMHSLLRGSRAAIDCIRRRPAPD